MNMFARFDEIPAMTLQDIKETKRYRRTHGQCEKSIPSTNKVCGEYNQWKYQLKYRTVKPEMTGRIIKQPDITRNGPQGLSGTTWPLPITIV